MDCSPPGSSVHGISQERILKWYAISFSRGSSQPMDQAGRFFTTVPPGKHWMKWHPYKPVQDFMCNCCLFIVTVIIGILTQKPSPCHIASVFPNTFWFYLLSKEDLIVRRILLKPWMHRSTPLWIEAMYLLARCFPRPEGGRKSWLTALINKSSPHWNLCFLWNSCFLLAKSSSAGNPGFLWILTLTKVF